MSEEIKSVVLKNKLLQPLIEILDCQLPGAKARARNKFVTTLGTQLVLVDEERRKMYSDAAIKDAEGKPKTKQIMNPTTNQPVEIFDLTPEASKKVSDDLQAFLDEDFVIDILPSNKFEIQVVSEIVLNTTKEFGLIDGAQYDLICAAFEAVKE